MSSPGERATRKLFWLSVLFSLLLHLAGIGVLEFSWQGGERTIRVRLAQPPRLAVRRFEVVPVPGPARPLTQMERLAPEPGGPRQLSDEAMPLSGTLPALPGPQGRRGGPAVTAEGAPLSLRELSPGAKSEYFAPTPERLQPPGELGLASTALTRTMELLRLQDMARGNKDHAVVIPDLSSRRDLKGYFNLTRVRIYGAGSVPGDSGGSGSVDDLARYMRDYTRILVQAQPGYYDYFLSEQLLKDPIHFLFQGQGIRPYRPEQLTYFSPEEYALLGRYLHSGGFLFVEGDRYNKKYQFLTEMKEHLEHLLGAEGRLRPLPLSHPIYTAYYDFSGGFPGEQRLPEQALLDSMGSPWYYPGTYMLEPAPPPVSPINPQLRPIIEAPPLGLWGVELNGQLVAVLSDLNLHNYWTNSPDAQQSGADPTLYSLMASTNIVVYALTRPGGMTPQLPPAAWEHRKPQVAVAEARSDTGGSAEEILDELDASLALVQTPLGRELEEGGVQVIIDGRYSVELLKRGLHGVVFHNLPAGSHWLEVRYSGKSRQLDVALKGGRVCTVSFGLNRFAFLTQLHLRQQEEVMEMEAWRANFFDLRIEEVFLGEDRKILE